MFLFLQNQILFLLALALKATDDMRWAFLSGTFNLGPSILRLSAILCKYVTMLLLGGLR